jgi:hypothetical protein
VKQHEVTVSQIGLIAGTRAMLGAGIALLLSEKLTDAQRRAIGWTLVAVGALTTIPIAMQLLGADEGRIRSLGDHPPSSSGGPGG